MQYVQAATHTDEDEAMTKFQAYRKMNWTSDSDECENACGTVMSESHYVSGELGHYCSKKCRDKAESGGDFDYRSSERKQMGITS